MYLNPVDIKIPHVILTFQKFNNNNNILHWFFSFRHLTVVKTTLPPADKSANKCYRYAYVKVSDSVVIDVQRTDDCGEDSVCKSIAVNATSDTANGNFRILPTFSLHPFGFPCIHVLSLRSNSHIEIRILLRVFLRSHLHRDHRPEGRFGRFPERCYRELCHGRLRGRLLQCARWPFEICHGGGNYCCWPIC